MSRRWKNTENKGEGEARIREKREKRMVGMGEFRKVGCCGLDKMVTSL